MKREFLMLAQKFSDRHNLCGWYMSEKLDGLRVFWDGGISRGLECYEVPYANVTKHGRYLIAPKATGLWTRYGQPLQAPDWFLNRLPKQPLDGEAWTGRGGFQDVLAAKTLDSNCPIWDKIIYQVFDSPPYHRVFSDGNINNGNFKKIFKGIMPWVRLQLELGEFHDGVDAPFYKVNAQLKELWKLNKPTSWQVLEQVQLPSCRPEVDIKISSALDKVIGMGGEGLILRSPISYWKPERTHDLLKVKPVDDMEGIVIGYRWGKPTDVEKSVSGEASNKLLGLMGCVILKLDSGVTFDLGSGFTHAERVMSANNLDSEAVFKLGCEFPGQAVQSDVFNAKFPLGSKLTFKYRELTKDGVPKEARYYRVLHD